jgi:hypothetical protein
MGSHALGHDARMIKDAIEHLDPDLRRRVSG